MSSVPEERFTTMLCHETCKICREVTLALQNEWVCHDHRKMCREPPRHPEAGYDLS